MSAEKKDHEVVKLKNKDVTAFQSGVGHVRVFGIKDVNLLEKELTLVDKDSSMTALISKDMSSKDRHLLASSVGKVVNILQYKRLNAGSRYFMVVQSFKIVDQTFEQIDNYKYLKQKIMGFTNTADIYNLQRDLDNIKFVPSIIHILYWFSLI